jgi:hypothetical protein
MFLDKFKKKVRIRQDTSKEVRDRTQYQAMSSRMPTNNCAIRPET